MTTYRQDIDGLRALAVLPVLFFHAGFEFFKGGYIGVDIFFVISGFLITSIILKESKAETFSLSSFYERRARRILPALFFVMLICLPFSWFWLTPSDLESFGGSLISTSTFWSNIFFWKESGYFGVISELKPLLHTWSLAVEEQYYVLFPLFMIFSWRFGIKFITLFLIVVFLISLSLAEYGSHKYPEASFYLLPTRGWELLIGVFLAIYLEEKAQIESLYINQSLSILGICMIIGSILIFNDSTPFPGLYALLPTLATAFLILCSVPGTIVHKMLCNKILVTTGLMSYSIYLWHQPILSFARHRSVDHLSDLESISLLLLSILMGYVSWKWIERPFRNRKVTSRGFIFTFSILGMILLSLIGNNFIKAKGYPERVNFSKELTKSFERPRFDQCFDFSFDALTLENHLEKEWGCNLGIKKDSTDALFFGDSHSLSYRNILDEISHEADLKIFYAGLSACLPLQDVFIELRGNCNLLNQMILQIIENNDIKKVILSARWSHYLVGTYYGEDGFLISEKRQGPYIKENRADIFKKSLIVTLNKLKKLDVEIHILGQPPTQYSDAESIYFKAAKLFGNLDSFSVQRKDFEKLTTLQDKLFGEQEPYLRYHNLLNSFCDKKICRVGEEDQSFYYDDDHLSNRGALQIKPLLESILL